MADDFPQMTPWVECWQCNGEGMLPGCFEDTCCGADCDPEDAAFCCAPSKCDVCKGKGGWEQIESQPPSKPIEQKDER